MNPLLTLDPNHYHARGVEAKDCETEVQIVGLDSTNMIADLIVLTPAAAAELGAWLASEQLAIRDSRIEELEARVAELEREAEGGPGTEAHERREYGDCDLEDQYPDSSRTSYLPDYTPGVDR